MIKLNFDDNIVSIYRVFENGFNISLQLIESSSNASEYLLDLQRPTKIMNINPLQIYYNNFIKIYNIISNNNINLQDFNTIQRNIKKKAYNQLERSKLNQISMYKNINSHFIISSIQPKLNELQLVSKDSLLFQSYNKYTNNYIDDLNYSSISLSINIFCSFWQFIQFFIPYYILKYHSGINNSYKHYNHNGYDSYNSFFWIFVGLLISAFPISAVIKFINPWKKSILLRGSGTTTILDQDKFQCIEEINSVGSMDNEQLELGEIVDNTYQLQQNDELNLNYDPNTTIIADISPFSQLNGFLDNGRLVRTFTVS